jgi:photosystem II stability/assembly factor-like uncharacterized protein
MEVGEQVNRINKDAQSSKPLLSKKLLIAIGSILLVTVIVVASIFIFGKKPKDQTANNDTNTELTPTPTATAIPTPAIDASTGYTGIVEDVITKQTFECAPRNDHEWYRTDRTFTIDYTDPNTMYVNVEYKGIFKSIDGGKTWTQKTKGIKVYARSDDLTKGCYSEYPVIKMDPKDHLHLILGASGGGGGFLSPTGPNAQTGGVYQTFDGGETWKLMINDKMNIYVNDIAIDPIDPQTIYYSTASNPASFTEADQNKLFVTIGLIYKTTDYGKTWEELPTGIGRRTGATTVNINPKNTNEIVATTYSAIRQSSDGTGTGISDGKDTTIDQMGILRSLDGGKTWTSTKLPTNHAIAASFVSPTNFKNQFFIIQGDLANFSYVTTDGGITLKKTSNMTIVEYDPFDPTGMHALAYTINPQGMGLNLNESKDGGVTWKTYGKLPKEMVNINDSKTRPNAMTWHPTDKKTIFLSGAGGHIWKSTDLGLTWTTLLDYTMLPK